MLILLSLLACGDDDPDVAGLAAQVASLEETVALQADDIATLQQRLDAQESRALGHGDSIAELETTTATLGDEVAALTSDLVDLQGAVGDIEGGVGDLEADVFDHANRLAAVEADLVTVVPVAAAAADLLTYVSADTSSDEVVFSGANVFIDSGAGSTDATVNGLGNLIVGYGEGHTATGSHNLVVGMAHTYSSFGGVVFGYANTATDERAAVLGGSGNTASGGTAVVLGGYGNTASGTLSTVFGGQGQEASGTYDYAP